GAGHRHQARIAELDQFLQHGARIASALREHRTNFFAHFRIAEPRRMRPCFERLAIIDNMIDGSAQHRPPFITHAASPYFGGGAVEPRTTSSTGSVSRCTSPSYRRIA